MPSFPRAKQGREAEQTDLHPRAGFPEVLRVFLTARWVERSRLTGWTMREGLDTEQHLKAEEN